MSVSFLFPEGKGGKEKKLPEFYIKVIVVSRVRLRLRASLLPPASLMLWLYHTGKLCPIFV